MTTRLPLILLLTLASGALAQPALFPMEPGTQWKYRSTTRSDGQEKTDEVSIAAEKEKVEVGKQPAVLIGPTAYAARDDGIYAVGEKTPDGIRPLDPARKILPATVRAGEKWNYREEAGNTAVAVLGDEKVQAPAGEFDATKVFAATAGAKGYRREVTRWYAPGVGLVRETTMTRRISGEAVRIVETNLELVSHQPPGGAATAPAPDRVAALFAEGEALARKGDHKAAIARYDEAIALDPRAAKAHAWRALSLLASRRPDEADAAIARALELNPQEFTYQEIAGQIRLAQGKLDEGAKLYDKAAALAPKNAGAIYMDLAGVLAARNDPRLTARVEQALRKSAEADPPHADALFALGQMYIDAGRPEARKFLQRYVDLVSSLPADQRDERKLTLARQMIKALEAAGR